MGPILERLSSEGDYDDLVFAKINVDEQRAISQEAGVRAVRCYASFGR
jgi:thiol-disulfide isomerase/thioredoxin